MQCDIITMSEGLTISDVNGICRLCLKDNGTIIPIFGRENTSRDCIPLSKKILDCVSINVVNGDGLPTMICVSCTHQVDSWHGFKTVCDTSQKKLSAWLQKTKPELFQKKEAEERHHNRISTVGTGAIIDVSSGDDDDDEVVITETVDKLAKRMCRRNRHSSHLQNIQLLSINTNEIEILPVDEGDSNHEHVEYMNDHEQPLTTIVPDVVSSSETEITFVPRFSDDHILPDSDMTEVMRKRRPDFKELKNVIKAVSTDSVTKGEHTITESLVESSELEKRQTEANTTQCDFDVVKINEQLHNVGEHESELTPQNIQDPLEVDGGTSSLIKLKSTGDNVGKEDYMHNISSETSSQVNDADVVSSAQNSNFDKPQGALSVTSEDDSSSILIEKITSLSNHERMDIDENSQELEDVEKITSGGQRFSRVSQDEDSQDSVSMPNIFVCDNSMAINIKEEPLSAGEATGEEEDPLNFHSIILKAEPEDMLCETEDIKPNVKTLNDAMANLYTPKRLKNGKYHCEPCRISFINDVYYERHATSLRHRINIKLFRSGRAPTKKRGRSLVQAVMGSNYDTGSKKTGPFYCTQCPSVFKHLRNLTTHKKKHLIETQYSDVDQPTPSGSRDICSIEKSETPSKSTLRLSAQNTKYVNVTPLEPCELCNRTFTTLPALLSHKRHCGSSESKICSWCHQDFSTLSLYFKHRKDCIKLYRQIHLNVLEDRPKTTSPASTLPIPKDGSVLACTLCNLTFSRSSSLIDHMQQNHMDFGTNEPSTELPEFAKPNHSSRINDPKLHYCKYCFKSFTTHGAISSHTGYHARKSVYWCKFCKHCDRDKLTFRQHMKEHISNPNLNRNVCWICYTPFSSQQDLILHKNIHANIKMKIFSCTTCGNSYNTKELLSKHKRSAHPSVMTSDDLLDDTALVEPKVQLIDEDNKLFKCKICKKRFTTVNNLRRHGLIHKRPAYFGGTGIEHVYQNQCNWCLRSFKTQSGLLNHKPLCNRVKTSTLPNFNNTVIGHPFTKAFKCKDCKKWFSSKNSLYKHRVLKRCRALKVEMIQLKPQNCPSCDQQFLSEESLDRHKQNCKPTIERLTCDCGEVFSSIDQKKTHAETCLQNCSCKFCNMKFNSPEEMESHKSICEIQQTNASTTPNVGHEGRMMPPLECHKCNKKFVYSKCLRMHVSKCTNDRWPCPYCLEVFGSETALATHKKSCQSPSKNIKSPPVTSIIDSPTFKCEYCPMRFISGNELKQHTINCENKPDVRRKDISTVHRPWSCDLCDKSFLWKANLYRHQKIIHNLASPSKRGLSFTNSNNESAPTREEGRNEVFKCDFCPGIIFHKEQGFMEHQLAHEREQNKRNNGPDIDDGNKVLLTCELCDKRIPETLYPMHMDEHMNDDFEGPSQQAKENSSEIFACDICGKEFGTFISRKSHRATHYRNGDVLAHHMSPKKKDKRKMKVKHVRCSICHKLLSINSMPKHKMMHAREEAEFYGGSQSSTSVKASPASNTTRSVTPSAISDATSNSEVNEDSITVFSCSKCDGSFRLRKSLQDHMKVHAEDSLETESTSSATGTADQYQYKCVYCDLSWKYNSLYEKHLNSKKHLEIKKQLSGII